MCAHCYEQGYSPPNKFLAGRHLILPMSAQRKVHHAGGAKIVFLIMHGLTFSIKEGAGTLSSSFLSKIEIR